MRGMAPSSLLAEICPPAQAVLVLMVTLGGLCESRGQSWGRCWITPGRWLWGEDRRGRLFVAGVPFQLQSSKEQCLNPSCAQGMWQL